MTDNQTSRGKVFRRRVFYIPGYDPKPPRRYRELYRSESAAQAAVSGYAVTMGPRRAQGKFGWQARTEMEGAPAETEFEVLIWADIVRGSMTRRIFATYWKLLVTAWIYISTGVLFRLMRLRKGPVIAALYPIVFLLVQLALAVGLAVAIIEAVLAGFNWALGPREFGALALIRLGIAVNLGAVAGYGVLRWFRRQDGRFFAYYLMHDFAHAARGRGAYSAEVEARIALFQDQISQALQGDYDEVLVVGHSSGAYLGVSILADVIRGGVPKGGPELAFLSLGQVVPMISFLPRADRLRADLNFLSQQDGVTWVDVTAPGDGCAFALCDPVAVSGVAEPGKRWPLVVSAAFSQTLSAARWKALRWRFFRLHFQYLCAFDAPGDYDYFRITAGPVTLAQRYAGRAASKSRIERAVSRYRSMAA